MFPFFDSHGKWTLAKYRKIHRKEKYTLRKQVSPRRELKIRPEARASWIAATRRAFLTRARKGHKPVCADSFVRNEKNKRSVRKCAHLKQDEFRVVVNACSPRHGKAEADIWLVVKTNKAYILKGKVYVYNLCVNYKYTSRGSRNGSVVKSATVLHRLPQFSSCHTHWGTQDHLQSMLLEIQCL